MEPVGVEVGFGVEKMKIPPAGVTAYYVPGDNLVKVEARGLSIEIAELPEHGGRGDRVTPLESFLAGLASCEVFMFRHIAEQLGVKAEYSVVVDVRGDFEFGEGLTHLDLTVKVKGLSREDAEKIFEMVKDYCPVYNTLKKVNATIHEKVVVE